MLEEERQQRITALLTLSGRITIEQIRRELGVSRETVRRDLVALESLGELRRVRGGAASVGPAAVEAPFRERIRTHYAQKKAIARLAARMAAAGRTIFLDTGSTTLALADELLALGGLTLITNSIDIAARFAALDTTLQARNRVIMLRGTLALGVPAACGEATVTDIQRYRTDLAMVSPFSLDAAHGAMSFDPREAAIAEAMCACAREVVILADHSKIGQSSRIRFRTIDAIDTLVTDGGARRLSALQAIARAGVHVQIAKSADVPHAE